MSSVRLLIVDDDGRTEQAWILDNGDSHEMSGVASDLLDYHLDSTGIDPMPIQKLPLEDQVNARLEELGDAIKNLLKR